MSRKNDYLWPGPTKADAHAEQAAIDARIGDARRFQKTLAFAELSIRQRNLFEAQLSAMQSYSLLLGCRLEDWEADL